MVDAGFRLGRRRTLLGAWYVLRANQVWAPYPDNDPDAAREQMRRFYALVARRITRSLDPARAAALEVEWWRVHRAHQHSAELTTGSGRRSADDDEPVDDPLTAALVALYSYVYAGAAGDRPVGSTACGCTPWTFPTAGWLPAVTGHDPLLTEERRLLDRLATARCGRPSTTAETAGLRPRWPGLPGPARPRPAPPARHRRVPGSRSPSVSSGVEAATARTSAHARSCGDLLGLRHRQRDGVADLVQQVVGGQGAPLVERVEAGGDHHLLDLRPGEPLGRRTEPTEQLVGHRQRAERRSRP